jgi:hypothetical protein
MPSWPTNGKVGSHWWMHSAPEGEASFGVLLLPIILLLKKRCFRAGSGSLIEAMPVPAPNPPHVKLHQKHPAFTQAAPLRAASPLSLLRGRGEEAIGSFDILTILWK